MVIKIVGINGYLGHLVAEELRENNHHVSGIERQLLYGDNVLLQDKIRGCDVLVNLAGATILRPWTKKNKENIYNSRVRVTQHIVSAINALPLTERPKRFIQTSAIGIYTPDTLHSELSTQFSQGFLGRLVSDWEAPLQTLHYSVEKTILRLGLVLGQQSKIVQYLSPSFRFSLGAKIGTGKQAFPFIHEYDFKRAYLAACEGNIAASIYNLVAPQQINNNDFSQSFARQFNKKARLTVPPLLLKLVLGQASQLLLENPQVDSAKMVEAGYTFSYPTIDATLRKIICTT